MSQRLEQLTRLQAEDPDDPFLTYGIALEHAKAGRLDDALDWLDRTLTIDSRYCYAYFQKGKLLAEQGDAVAARAALEAGQNAARSSGDDHAYSEISELLASID